MAAFIIIFIKKYLKYKINEIIIELNMILNTQIEYNSRIIELCYITISENY